MLVVLASPRDTAAERLAACWAGQGAALLTPTDLSRPGWCFDPAAPARGIAVIAGRRTPVRAIRGVLTRLPAVFASDLPHIVAADLAYVAEEMSAFLLAWLSSLRCPVVNRPVPPSLAGPNWRQAQWVYAAVRAGLRASHPSDSGAESDAQTAIVLGGRCLSVVESSLAKRIERLAALADVSLLAVRLSGADATARFAAADPWPDPSPPEVADALLRYFESCGRC